VFDDRWRVVALHIGAEAVENVSFQGRSTAWVNVGAQMAAILQDLETNAPAVYAEIQG
jgi:hypothetical protein